MAPEETRITSTPASIKRLVCRLMARMTFKIETIGCGQHVATDFNHHALYTLKRKGAVRKSP